jgi:putative ABC transport system substrate-binding protein
MQRREFIGLVGSLAAGWSGIAHAQQPVKTRRIGVLFALPEDDRQAHSRLAAFRGELKKLGWADIAIDARYVPSNDAETHQRCAKELVALQPDLILAQNTDATRALLEQTRAIPIIFTIVADPIGNGLELLKEISPTVTRVLVPFNTATASAEYWLAPLKSTAALLGIDVSAVFIHDTAELEAAIVAHARTPQGGLVVFPDAYITGHRAEMTALAARCGLPAIYPFRFFAESGGLVAYGADLLDNFRRAAIYADRILKGEKVSELPVQAPEKFELVINLRVAKALGVEVPASVIARADEVIE